MVENAKIQDKIKKRYDCVVVAVVQMRKKIQIKRCHYVVLAIDGISKKKLWAMVSVVNKGVLSSGWLRRNQLTSLPNSGT